VRSDAISGRQSGHCCEIGTLGLSMDANIEPVNPLDMRKVGVRRSGHVDQRKSAVEETEDIVVLVHCHGVVLFV